MSKTRKYVVNGIVTPEMLEDTNQKSVPRDVVKIIRDVARAQKSTEKSAYTIAYNLALLQYAEDKDNSVVKKMGYKDIRDFAEVFFNIAPATAYCYAQTAKDTLTRDDKGIHSIYQSTYCDAEGKEHTEDFTVTQLQELRGIKPEIVDRMLCNGSMSYGSTTKGMRARMQIVKQLTDSKSKYYMSGATPEDIADKVAEIVPMLAIKGNDTGIKAIEAYIAEQDKDKVPAPDETTTPDTTPDETTTPDTEPDSAENPDSTYEDFLETIAQSIATAIKVCDLDELRAVLEHGLDEIAERMADNND